VGERKTFDVKNEAAWEDVAAYVAPRLRPGYVFFLEGDLGMGKTSFARTLIRAVSANPALDVPSPTYTLVQTYDTPMGALWHWDLYRLKTPEDLYELGWEAGVSDRAIMLVEWPARGGASLPPAHGTLVITQAATGGRRAEWVGS
jgi:tRNA threonylcarbamoyl adenosine modification protein YjeE